MAHTQELAYVLDEVQALDAVQSAILTSLDRAPWPRAIALGARKILTEPGRALGGRLTPWTLAPLCCCAAACGAWLPAVPAAASAEVYATALDLLDDIEDGDRSQTVERFGIPITLNLTTALLGLAHEILRDVPSDLHDAARRAQDALWYGLVVATGGQHLDLAGAGGAPFSVDECLDVARRKGGALVEACCRAGAVFGTGDDCTVNLIGALGQSLGLYAQIDNDMHDVEEQRGKTDFERLTQTIPVAYARTHGTAGDLSRDVWQGGVQLAYALKHAERARIMTALDAVAETCPNPGRARDFLNLLLTPLPSIPPIPTS